MRRSIDHDGGVWRTATFASGVLFIMQVILLLGLHGIREPDYGAIPTIAYFVVAVCSSVVTAFLRWRWGSNRGLVLAGTGTTALWVFSAVVISLLSWTAG